MNHRALCCAIVICAAAIAFAQETARRGDEQAHALLKQVESNLSSARTLSVDISGVIRDQRPDRTPEVAFEGTARLMKPNFASIRYQTTSKKDGVETKSSWVVVSDGKSVWKLDVEKNKYVKRDAAPDGKNILTTAALPLDAPLYAFFSSRLPHATTPAIMAPAESWKDAAHQVVEFRDGDVNADGVPATRQRFYFGPDESMREVNEQLSGKFVADAEFRNVIKNAPMSEADFTYAPPATAQDATPPKPQMLANGSVAPDFTVQDLAGRPLKLSDFRGKIVVLDFWSTNCGPCIESRDHLNAVAGKFGDDVVFLAVDVWDKKADIDAWLPKHPQYDKLRFAIDPRPAGSDSATLYQAPGVPALFVIGRDGKTTYSLLGWDGPNSDLEIAVKRAGGTAR